MSNSDTSINRAYLTNDYSIVSKYSACKLGYFQDETLEKFIENHLKINKSWRRTPLVNRGYGARLMAIDWIVGRSLSYESIDCAIVLGSGFDMTPQRRIGQCRWIEIDLPQVIEVKCKYIMDKLNLADLSQVEAGDGMGSFHSIGVHLIACDLRNTTELLDKLTLTFANINKQGPKIRNIAIINEVCLCYLEIEEVKRILETVIRSVDNVANKIHYIGYEQLRPDQHGDHKQGQQFSQVMLDHFESLGHPLTYFPTQKQIREVLVNYLKFNNITIAPMYQIYHNALIDQKSQFPGYSNEPFDEFEEMDLYLGHYALVTGVMILKDPYYQYNISTIQEDYNDLTKQLHSIQIDNNNPSEISFVNSPVTRFGHSSCQLEDSDSIQSVLVSGGFGMTNEQQQHRRLSDCAILKRNLQTSDTWARSLSLELFDQTQSIRLDRVHGQVTHVENELLLFSGGRQSPQRNQQATNYSFLATLESNCNSIRLRHIYKEPDYVAHQRWRHKTIRLSNEKVIQVGGINGDQSTTRSKDTVFIWNLGSSKFGIESSSFETLDRHSFGMDLRDENTLLVLGGLSTLDCCDAPIDQVDNTVVILWDMRQSQVLKINSNCGSCYNNQVHFQSDNQFIRLGGISTKTGLTEEPIARLFDLRNLTEPILTNIIHEDQEQFFMLTNETSHNFKNSKQIVTFGGGGNFFTFGTQFNRSSLVYDYR